LTGATYVDTGMVSYAKKKKIWNTVQTVLAVGGLVSGGISIYGGALSAGVSGFGNAGIVGNAFRTAVGYNPLVMATPVMGWISAHPIATTALSWTMTGAYWLGAATSYSGIAANVVGWMNPNYDASKYLKGNLDMPVAVGESKTINGAEYTFMGSSNNGKNIYYDANKNIVYDDGHGNLLPVTDSTGQNAVYVEGGNTVLNAGNEVVGPQTTLKADFVPKMNDEDYGNYFETIDKLNENSISLSKKEEAAAEQAAAGNVNVAVPGGSKTEDDDSTSGTNGATTGTHKGNSSSTDENTTSGNNGSNNYTQGVMI
jgi:hypothetical protein